MEILIDSIESLIQQIKKDTSYWKEEHPLIWFRGQCIDKPLIPKLFREEYIELNENNLVQPFRMKARGLGPTPNYDRIDEWLFLMQHSGLPTRLLDWTEGALIALFFAIHDRSSTDSPNPVIWLLHPKALNVLKHSKHAPILPLSWYGRYTSPPCPPNIKAAFEGNDSAAYDLPVALMPQHVHIRVTVQRSCFTVHGKLKNGLNELVSDIVLEDDEKTEGYFKATGVEGKKFGDVFLKKYKIDNEKSEEMLKELKMLGITYSTLFPDFDGLAKDLPTSY